MKLIKLINGSFDLKDAEGAQAQGYLKDGYELAVTTDSPSPDAECSWQRIENGYVQVWQVDTETIEEE